MKIVFIFIILLVISITLKVSRGASDIKFETMIVLDNNCKYGVIFKMYEDDAENECYNTFVEINDLFAESVTPLDSFPGCISYFDYCGLATVAYYTKDSLGKYLIIRRFIEPKFVDTIIFNYTNIMDNDWLIGGSYYVVSLKDSLISYFDSVGNNIRKFNSKGESTIIQQVPYGDFSRFSEDYSQLIIEQFHLSADSTITKDLLIYDPNADSLYALPKAPRMEQQSKRLTKNGPVYYLKYDDIRRTQNLFKFDEMHEETCLTDLSFPYCIENYYLFEDSIIYRVAIDSGLNKGEKYFKVFKINK